MAGDIQRIVPYMAQGLDTGGRIGNEITAKALTVKGHMIMTLANAGYSGSVRIGVRMMCLTSKRYKHIDDLTTNPSLHLNFLLKSGNAIQPFSGNIPDLYLPINREVYTVHYDKVQYITIPLIYTNAGAVDLVNSVKMFSFSVPCKNKKITYEDSLSNAPQNWAPFWVIGYVKLDGSGPDTVLTNISCESISTLYYTDM